MLKLIRVLAPLYFTITLTTAINQQPLILSISKMAKVNRISRKTYRSENPLILSFPIASRVSKIIINTPRRTRLLCNVKLTAGKMPRKDLFIYYQISPATGYRIIKSNKSRRFKRIHKRGRKPILDS